jgi:hypothetical protein
MGYNIRLADVERCSTTEERNISYNFLYPLYYSLDEEDGLRWLDGKTGEEALPRLKAARDKLLKMRAEDFKFDHDPTNTRLADKTAEDDRYAIRSMIELIGMLLRWLQEEIDLNGRTDLTGVKFFV